MLLTSIEALDTMLPYLLVLAAASVLTGNHIARVFLSACGLDFRARQLSGLGFAAAAFAMFAGITSCHATTALIVFLFALSANAMRLGGLRPAGVSAVCALALIPLVVVS
jgi:hypothetical protein